MGCMRPEDTFGHKFRVINNSIDKYMDWKRKREETILTRAQCGVIHYLSESPDEIVFQKDIEEIFHISGATASNMLKGMERHGMIQRVSFEGDARRKRIILTEKAMEQHNRAHRNIEHMEQCITAGMSEEEIRQLHSLLDKIIYNISEPDQNQKIKEL